MDTNYTPLDTATLSKGFNKKAIAAGFSIAVMVFSLVFVRISLQNRSTTQSSAAGNCPNGYEEFDVNQAPPSCASSITNPTPIGGTGSTVCCQSPTTPGGACSSGSSVASGTGPGTTCPGGALADVQCNGDQQCSYCCPDPTPTPTDHIPPPTPTDTPPPTPTGTLTPTPTCFVPQPTLSIICPNGCVTQ